MGLEELDVGCTICPCALSGLCLDGMDRGLLGDSVSCVMPKKGMSRICGDDVSVVCSVTGVVDVRRISFSGIVVMSDGVMDCRRCSGTVGIFLRGGVEVVLTAKVCSRVLCDGRSRGEVRVYGSGRVMVSDVMRGGGRRVRIPVVDIVKIKCGMSGFSIRLCLERVFLGGKCGMTRVKAGGVDGVVKFCSVPSFVCGGEFSNRRAVLEFGRFMGGIRSGRGPSVVVVNMPRPVLPLGGGRLFSFKVETCRVCRTMSISCYVLGLLDKRCDSRFRARVGGIYGCECGMSVSSFFISGFSVISGSLCSDRLGCMCMRVGTLPGDGGFFGTSSLGSRE